jgi:ABC-type multidrug transport system ATPase subunit
MTNISIVKIDHLCKSFKSIKAVDNLSLNIFEGDIYGFLGPNGSGKSTTIRLILSLIKPDSGNVQLFGKPVKSYQNEVLTRIGAFVEKPDFYEYLSAYKNLEMMAVYSRIPKNPARISEVLDLVGLLDRSKSKVSTFSKGMKQRLGISQALLHDPDLLILDEPSSGLDPSGMHDIRNLIKFLNEEKNKTIILSSHNLKEIEAIANRMIIINKGKKIVEGDVKTLLEKHRYYTIFVFDDKHKAKKLLDESSFKIEKVEIKGQELRVYCQRGLIPEINAYLVHKGIAVESINTEQSLEDYFLKLT